MIAKCGEIKIWHWAHKPGTKCDIFSKPESDWHIAWKKKFPKENVKVIIIKNDEKHIADAYLPKSKTAIEFQNSSITARDIRRRTEFYDHLIWIFNVKDAYEEDRLYAESENNYVWEHPKTTIRKIYWKSKVFLDTGYELWHIKYIYTRGYNDFGGADWDLDIDEYEYNEFIEKLKPNMEWQVNLNLLQSKKSSLQVEQLELF